MNPLARTAIPAWTVAHCTHGEPADAIERARRSTGLLVGIAVSAVIGVSHTCPPNCQSCA